MRYPPDEPPATDRTGDDPALAARSDLFAALTRLFDDGPCAVLVFSADGTITEASDSCRRWLGRAPAELLGSRPEQILAEPGATIPGWVALQDRARRHGRASTEVMIHNLNMRPFWCALVLDALAESPGGSADWLLTLTDITQRRILTELQEPVLDAMVRDLPLAEVMKRVCTQVQILAPDVVATVLVVDETGRVRPLAGPSVPIEVSSRFDGAPIGPKAGSCGTAAWRGCPVVVTDIDTDPLWDDYRHVVQPLGLRACWSSPIKNSDGRVLATFAFYFREPRAPHGLHEQLVEMSVHLCTLALERERSHAHIHQLAYYDSLTGLPNRSLLQANAARAIGEARQGGTTLALLFIDLDRFKDVNDSHGHAVGDELLRQVAQRLAEEVRDRNLVCRLAGDEFVVVLPHCGVEQARHTAERVQQALARPIAIGDLGLTAGVCVGVAIFPDDGADLDLLLRHADAAMYQAKKDGRGGMHFYRAEMNRAAEDRLRLAADLRAALHHGGLQLHFQPQVCPPESPAADGASISLFGVEALLRWHHPALGEISPERFIPVAEESGLTDELSHWVLETACAQLARWRTDGIDVPRVAVNLSPRNFQDPGLPVRVRQLLDRHGLRGDQLTLELTESAWVDRRVDSLDKLRALQALGVCLSMDDFGNGCSSLSHLHRLPIRQLKLDRSFVQDLEHLAVAQTLAAAMLHIGQSLGLTVVAEGIETAVQAAFLIERGCPVLQGDRYARAMAAEQIGPWLAEAGIRCVRAAARR
jgi:diguanylate cyclase (GGDEF)-like protein